MLNELNPSSDKELARMLMVDDCPRCGSKNTKDCDTIVDVEDNTIGICLDCGYIWCLECGYELKEKICPHWSACSDCDQTDAEGSCPHAPEISECPIIQNFMKNNYHSMKGEFQIRLNPPRRGVDKGAICAFCNILIEEENEVYSIGVKVKKGVTLQQYEGQMIRLPFSNMSLPAIVTAANSQAK
jgi:hypothetical protein